MEGQVVMIVAKKRNPAIVKAEEDFFLKGSKIGFDQGIDVSRIAAQILHNNKLEELKNVKGIGPKIYKIIESHFEGFLDEIPDDIHKKIGGLKK